MGIPLVKLYLKGNDWERNRIKEIMKSWDKEEHFWFFEAMLYQMEVCFTIQ